MSERQQNLSLGGVGPDNGRPDSDRPGFKPPFPPVCACYFGE